MRKKPQTNHTSWPSDYCEDIQNDSASLRCRNSDNCKREPGTRISRYISMPYEISDLVPCVLQLFYTSFSFSPRYSILNILYYSLHHVPRNSISSGVSHLQKIFTSHKRLIIKADNSCAVNQITSLYILSLKVRKLLTPNCNN